MTNKRASERWSLMDYQKVQDTETGKTVGYLGDINAEGLKLLSKKPFPVGERFSLKPVYLLLDGQWESPVLEVESVWAQAGEGAPFCETGFRLESVSEELTRSIDAIVADLRARSD